MKEQNAIHVIGIDASGLEGIPLSLEKIILSAKKIAGPSRIINLIPSWLETRESKDCLPELFITDKLSSLIDWISKDNKTTVILSSGDPLWFGIGRFLLNSLPPDCLIFHPAPTSLQLAFARIKRPWQDAEWISIHGRDISPLWEKLRKRPKALAILTNPGREGVEEVKQFLISSGLENSYTFWLFEQLGHKEERVSEIKIRDVLPEVINELNLVIITEKENSINNPRNLPLFGIEDGVFAQHKDRPGLMTKREARVHLLAELELPESGVLWDIGSGVGSIGLEALRIRPNLKLLAIEKRKGSTNLIKRNSEILGVRAPTVIELDALEAIKSKQIPSHMFPPSRIVIGGSSGKKRKEILSLSLNLLGDQGLLVIPLSTLDDISELSNIINDSGYIFSISQHQSWRGVPIGEGTRLQPMNPIFIIKAKK